MGQDLNTPARDHVNTKRYGFAPSFSVDVTDKTKATVAYIYQDEDSVPDYGHPYLPRRPTMPAPVCSAISATTETAAPTPPVPIDAQQLVRRCGRDSARSCADRHAHRHRQDRARVRQQREGRQYDALRRGGSLRASDRTAQPRRCGEHSVPGKHHGPAQSERCVHQLSGRPDDDRPPALPDRDEQRHCS